MTMRTFDFAPLYRSTIGFDHLTALFENANKNENKENSKNWTSKIYIKDDMHLREFGHKIVAKKILNVGFN